MAREFDVQVPRDQYFQNYDDLTRFISYFYQVDLVKGLRPKQVLEIGVGNKTVTNYLKQHGFEVDTCDFDAELEPDHVADIRDLPFDSDSYDLVMACQVLEHLPWEEVGRALGELRRVTRRLVLISLPHASASFDLLFQFPLANRILQPPFLRAFVSVPLSFTDTPANGEHYWEIGRRGYPLRRIRRALRDHFDIIREARAALHSYHHFFVLEKDRRESAG